MEEESKHCNNNITAAADEEEAVFTGTDPSMVQSEFARQLLFGNVPTSSSIVSHNDRQTAVPTENYMPPVSSEAILTCL